MWDGKAGYEKSFDVVTVDETRTNLTVRARTIAAIQKFFSTVSNITTRLRAQLTAGGTSPLIELSPADLVAVALRQTARDLRLTPAEMKQSFQVQFAQRQVATLWREGGILGHDGG
jgi:hypothetical protein